MTAQNTTHGADRDLNSALDRLGRFMPVGFHYRSFFGPRKTDWLRCWEPLIRRSAGLGRIDTALPPADYRKRNLHCDVLVVGAGPAARRAAQAGAEVVLVDFEPETGGALTYGCHADDLLQRQREGLQGLRILQGATIAAAQGTHGNRRVKSLRVETASGHETLDCDLAVIDAAPRLPASAACRGEAGL